MNPTRNKHRGRKFQAKLAQMAQGVNIGTLGGEDVMHPEFSYEAKTYLKNCKTHGGKDWAGEVLLSQFDHGLASVDLVIIEINSSSFASLMMLRWAWWEKIASNSMEKSDITISTIVVEMTRFVGNTYMDQAEANCPDAKIPIVVVHTTGRRHEQDIVLMRSIYWKSLLENFS